MFRDREEAGELLVEKLKREKIKADIVLGITRGGVVSAKYIAQRFSLPLFPLVIKKMGAPKNQELAIGAVGPENSVYWDERLCRHLGLNEKQKKELLEEKKKEREALERKLKVKSLDLEDKKIILVDDGVATGASAICAVKFLRNEKVREVIFATPVAAKDVLKIIKIYFDRVIVFKTVESFRAVGEFYDYFPQVGNEEVSRIIG